MHMVINQIIQMSLWWKVSCSPILLHSQLFSPKAKSIISKLLFLKFLLVIILITLEKVLILVLIHKSINHIHTLPIKKVEGISQITFLSSSPMLNFHLNIIFSFSKKIYKTHFWAGYFYSSFFKMSICKW